MKLDLINNRFPMPKNHRVVDSLEDQPIAATSQCLSKTSLVKMSIAPVKIRANQSRGLAKQMPTRFDVAKVDRKGHLIEVYERAANAKPTVLYDKPSHAALATRSSDSIIDTFFPSTVLEKNKDQSTSPTLDKIKDRIHDYDDYTVQSRLESKKLPGTISKAKRDMRPIGDLGQTTAAHVGPCTYDSSHLHTQSVPNIFLSSEKQTYFTPTEYKTKPLETPLRERLRLDRMVAQQNTVHAEQVALQQQYQDHIPDIEYDRILRKKHNPRIQFDNSNINRFETVEYRQEPYVKTTGLLLSQDYDKKFNKRIPFAFETGSNTSDSIFDIKGNASKDVDVDVGKHFALVTELSRSPIKYAAAFKSKQPSGMQIPTPTTAPHIGPGTFSDVYKSAVEVKRPDHLSLAFMTSRIEYTRPPMPDPHHKHKSFAEANTKGPIFPTERSTGDGNALNLHLTTIVKEKMSKIYPKLASKKFPENKVTSEGEEGSSTFGGGQSIDDYSIKKQKSFVFKKQKKLV